MATDMSGPIGTEAASPSLSVMNPLNMEEQASLTRSGSYASSSASLGSADSPLPEPFHSPHLGLRHDTLGAATSPSSPRQQYQHQPQHYPHHTTPPTKLGVVSLSVVVFYAVSGGPFGIEPAVRAAGNFYAILGFCLLPFLWSGPEAMMTAELGAAFPDAAGGVAWVQSAFGKQAGWMCGVCTWMGGATDNAIYPVLFLDYVVAAFGWEEHFSAFTRWLWLALCSCLLAYINWWGLPTVGKLSIVICIVAMSPFIILTLGSVFSLDPHRWTELPPDRSAIVDHDDDDDDDRGRALSSSAFWASLSNVRWAPFLNNLFWNGNSFDSCANFAADVDNPGRAFPKALGWSVALVTAGYVVPLLVILGATDASSSDWVDGYLAKAARDIMGPWLGGWTVFAAGISNIGQFQAELSSDA